MVADLDTNALVLPIRAQVVKQRIRTASSKFEVTNWKRIA